MPNPGEPLLIYSGGAENEIKTTITSFQGLKVMPSEIVTVTQNVIATVHYVLECRVTGGYQLKAHIDRTNDGGLPSLHDTAVLTTSAKYETHSAMAGFELPPGTHELYLEWCVSGGTGYIRYRFFTVTLTAV
jgi:hypothetical protein